MNLNLMINVAQLTRYCYFAADDNRIFVYLRETSMQGLLVINAMYSH